MRRFQTGEGWRSVIGLENFAAQHGDSGKVEPALCEEFAGVS